MCKSKEFKPRPKSARKGVHALQPANSSDNGERPKQNPSDETSSSDESSFVISSKSKRKQTPMAKLKLEGTKVELLIDTGVTVNVINSEQFDNESKAAAKPIKTLARICAYGSKETVPMKGNFQAVVESKKRLTTATFYVSKAEWNTVFAELRNRQILV